MEPEVNEEEEKEYKIEDAEVNSDNKDFMLQAIKDKATWVLAYASERLHEDKELMLKCAKVDGQILYYASKELRDDKELVLTAVSNKWVILKYASKRLRGDKDIALAALKQKVDAKMYLTDEIKKDPDIDSIINPKEEVTS